MREGKAGTCLRPILPYWMMAEAEAWTPSMALLLLGSCCVLVSYAVTMAADRDKLSMWGTFLKKKRKRRGGELGAGEIFWHRGTEQSMGRGR